MKKKKPVRGPVEISKKKKLPEKGGITLSAFHRLVDWASWWETWYTAIKPDGSYQYRRIRDLAREIGQTKDQVVFTEWYLGPPRGEGPDPRYTWCREEPLNWLEKRKTGGWYTPAALKTFGMEIRRRMSALEALREAGNQCTLNSLVRAEQMALELDRSFKGTMFLDSLTFEENIARAESYVALHEKVLKLKATAQDLYAKSHGVNFDDMSGLVQLMQAAAMNGATKGDDANSREKAALSALVEMAYAKSHRYALDLPPGSVEVMADAIDQVDKKRNLN